MSKLLIPSLQNFGTFITLSGLTDEDARQFARHFTDEVIATKKCWNTSPGEKLDINFYHATPIPELDMVAEEQDYLDLIKEQFAFSTVKGTKGFRVIFIGSDGVVGLGTTILYNERRAALNFTDPDALSQLIAINTAWDDADEPFMDITSAPIVNAIPEVEVPVEVVTMPVVAEAASKFYIDAKIETQTETKFSDQPAKKKGWLARIFGV